VQHREAAVNAGTWAGRLPDPVPAPDCEKCADFDAEHKAATGHHDLSRAVDLRILMRRHFVVEHE